jgi:uncharacterized protein (DUF427 family)
MTSEVKIPGVDHAITVAPTGARVTVRAGERVIADTTEALTLREANYPPVQYVPLRDVDPSAIRPTETSSSCPYKGTASYYSVEAADGELTDVIWTYERPHDAVAQIAGHVAFYPDRVQISVGDRAE